jgi:elongation factor G
MIESNPRMRPIVCVAIRPKANDDRESLDRALSDLAQQDPTMNINSQSSDAQIIIGGMGELHLQIICERILREYKIEINISKPEIIYLETIRKHAEAEGKYIRQTGGRGHYAHVKLRLDPREPGSGYQFVDEIVNAAVPPEFVEPVNLGIQQAMKGGILAGNEMVDLRAVLYDGSYHAEDSNEMSFKIAASMAFKEAARKADPVLLEPLMSVEIVTPEVFAGMVVGDLSRRRGQIEGMEHRAGSQVIRATVPMAELFGYTVYLREGNYILGESTNQRFGGGLTFSFSVHAFVHCGEALFSPASTLPPWELTSQCERRARNWRTDHQHCTLFSIPQ